MINIIKDRFEDAFELYFNIVLFTNDTKVVNRSSSLWMYNCRILSFRHCYKSNKNKYNDMLTKYSSKPSLLLFLKNEIGLVGSQACAFA